MASNKTYISVQSFVAVLFLIIAGLIPFLVMQEKGLYHQVIIISLGLGFLAALAAVFVLTLKVHKLKKGPEPRKESKKPTPKPSPRPGPASPPATVTPKELLDPGLVYRFRLGKDKSLESQSKRVVIGRHEGHIKTHSTEIIENHLELEFRIRQDPDRDIYNTDKTLIQKRKKESLVSSLLRLIDTSVSTVGEKNLKKFRPTNKLVK